MTAHRRLPSRYAASTRLLHSDRLAGVEHGAVHRPLHTSAAFTQPSARELAAVFQGDKSGHVYARQGNPTVAALEAKLALLEDGHAAACFSTGMAALSAVFMSLLRAGDHVVSGRHMFGNTNSLMQTLQRLGIEVSFVDGTCAQQVEGALTPGTRMVFVETIANPGTQVADLEGLGLLCSRHGVLLVVDSTLTTPVLCRAGDHGAGLVVHSLTKAICGHGNAMGGAVVDTGRYDWTGFPNILPGYRKGDPAGWGLLQVRKKGLRDLGGTLRAEDAHRIAVGAETLDLRIDRASRNALQLAGWLQAQPLVTQVHYPGLASHPQHERAARLFGGRFSQLLSFELDASVDPLEFLDELELVIVSSHLADNRTLAIPVASTIFHEMGAERRAEMGIRDGLIRCSVGIEAADDLIDDMSGALKRIKSKGGIR